MPAENAADMSVQSYARVEGSAASLAADRHIVTMMRPFVRSFSLWLVLALAFTGRPAWTQSTSPASTPSLAPQNPADSIPGLSDQKRKPTDDDADPTKNPIFLSLSPELQTKIASESQDFYRDCQSKSSYAVMHNCSCLSTHYVNQRIKHPDHTHTQIWEAIMTDCVDIPSITKYSHERCMELYASMFADILKPLCECYARDFADAYAKSPNTNSQYEVDLGVKTVMACRRNVTSMPPGTAVGQHH
ncbi:MAG: hypothetical protein ACREDM_00100 [Methylocella sp.]